MAEPTADPSPPMHGIAEEGEERDGGKIEPSTGTTKHSRPPPTTSQASGRGAGGPGGSGQSIFGSFGFPEGDSRADNDTYAPPSATSASEFKAPEGYDMSRRTSVSAESVTPANDNEDWKPPFYSKSEDDLKFLREMMSNLFLFADLEPGQFDEVLGAFQRQKVPAKGIRVIEQGDRGDFFYFVQDGCFDILRSDTGRAEPGPNGLGKLVARATNKTSQSQKESEKSETKSGEKADKKEESSQSEQTPETSKDGESLRTFKFFGELALMYNAPRAASVVSTEPSILWKLDRLTFRRIVMDAAFKRRRRYEALLEDVKGFHPLSAGDRSRIADALTTKTCKAKETIIQEGAPGDVFYILESGEAEARKLDEKKQSSDGKEGTQQKESSTKTPDSPPKDHHLMWYKKGDYFGELALLRDEPRACSIIAVTDCKLATLTKDGFSRLLGGVKAEMLKRNYTPVQQEG